MSNAGVHRSELDTPAYCLDVDLLDANIATMASFISQRGKQWRPHAKCHKSPEIANRQREAGAIGVTVAKVSEAEVFATAGVRDILIANLIVGPRKLARVVELCRTADPIVCIDQWIQAEMLSDVCRAAEVRCRVLVEIDIGMQRVGVLPGNETRRLAAGIDRLPGVELVGIMGYEGHLLTETDTGVKRRAINDAMNVLRGNRDLLRDAGLCCDIVSAGGSGSYQMTADCEGVTEIQAGGGVFADPFYLDRCGVVGLTPALRVIATVVSRPQLERAIVDVGRKAIHWDIHPPVLTGTVDGRPLPDARIQHLSAEHGVIELGPKSRDLQVGDKLEIIPGYSDHTTVLHDQFVVLKNDHVIDIWPIVARGMLQ